MLAQVINFSVIVFVLWFFALKPLVQKMADRTKKIEKSLAEAKEISEKFKRAEEEKQAIMQSARRDSQKILEESKSLAEKERETTVNLAKEQVLKVVQTGKAQLASEKERTFSELKQETAELVMLSTTKVLEKIVDKTIDQKIIKKAIQEISANK